MKTSLMLYYVAAYNAARAAALEGDERAARKARFCSAKLARVAALVDFVEVTP